MLNTEGRRGRAVDTYKWRRRTTIKGGQKLGLEALVFVVLKVLVFAPFFVSNGSKLWDLTVGTSFTMLINDENTI
jgi:hypothetical protein